MLKAITAAELNLDRYVDWSFYFRIYKSYQTFDINTFTEIQLQRKIFLYI